MSETEMKESKHRYSTYSLIFFLFLAGGASVLGLDSSDLDDVCDVNDHIMYRLNGTWLCANISNMEINFTVNNITNLNINWSIHSSQWDLLDSPSDIGLVSSFLAWVGDALDFNSAKLNSTIHTEIVTHPTGNTTVQMQTVFNNMDIWSYFNYTIGLVGGSPAVDGIHNKSTLTDETVLNVWFEENTTDMSGNGNTGFCQGCEGDENTTGIVGGAYEFDGTNDFINISYDPSLLSTITGDRTILAWIKVSVGGNDGIFTYMNSSSPFDGYIFRMSGVQIQYFDSGSGFEGANVPWSDGEWHHVGVTVNSGSGTFYDNGTAIGTFSGSNPGIRKGEARIGRSFGNDYFDGDIDELLVFNRSLSSGEVSAIYNDTLGHGILGGISAPTQLNMSLPLNMYGNEINNTANIHPDADATYSVGSSVLRWLKGWFVDLDVENNLDVGNNITAGGNITAENVFLPVYLSAHTNDTIPVVIVGVFYNLTFDKEEEFKRRITHSAMSATNTTFTIIDTGIYEITYSLTFEDSQATPLNHIVARIIKNNVELEGFTIEQDSTKQNADIGIHHSDLVELVTDDEIILQFTSDSTTVSLITHLTYGIHQNTGHITIKRVV